MNHSFHTTSKAPSMVRGFVTAAAGLAIAVTASLALSAGANAEEKLTGYQLWNNGGCFGCHGDLASGGGDAANPGAPSLRRRLSHELLVTAISCGRPKADMPSFLKDAANAELCKTAGVADNIPNGIVMDMYTAEEVDTLVAWLEENAVGKSRITRENCAVFFDGNPDTPTCRQY